AGAARVGAGGALQTQASAPHPAPSADGTTQTLDAAPPPPADTTHDAHPEPTPRPQNTTALPWGIAVLTAGLTVETYTGNA
ncbi:hypothetical protein GTY44_00665, partial [Streptomyces sp. SID5914]|nr:hypothetical protein [Streptomyces sp. SID5914]